MPKHCNWHTVTPTEEMCQTAMMSGRSTECATERRLYPHCSGRYRAHRVFERQEMQQRGLVLVTKTPQSSSGGEAAFHSLMLPSNRIGMKGSSQSGLRCACVEKGLLCQAPNWDYALHLMWLVDVPTDMKKPCQPECHLWAPLQSSCSSKCHS